MSTFYTSGTARASAVLQAAGAYDTSPIPLPDNTFTELTFFIAYTRGGAGGAISYKVEFSNDGFTWYQTAQFSPPAIAAGADSVFLTQRNELKYQATGATQERFTSPTFTVVGQFARISAKESGAVGTPGTALIEYHIRGDQT